MTGNGLTPLGGRLRLYLRYFLVDPCPIVRAYVCVLIDVCVPLLLYMLRGQHKLIQQHSRSKSSTKPLDLPIQNGNSVCPCSHVIPSHRPQRNTHLMSLTRLILIIHYTNPPSSRLHFPTSSVKNVTKKHVCLRTCNGWHQSKLSH